MGRKYKTVDIYIHIVDSFCCRAETNTTLQSNYTSIKQIIYKKEKIQGYIVQHREDSQYFIVTINGAQPLKIVIHYIIHL